MCHTFSMLTLKLPRYPGIDGILEASAVRGSRPCRHIAGLRHPWDSAKTTFKPVSARIFYFNHREIKHTGGNPEFKPHISSHKLHHLWLYLSVSLSAGIATGKTCDPCTSKASKQHSSNLIQQPFGGGPWTWISLRRIIS